MELTQKQIGQHISELRKLKGLSQEDLAKAIRISRSSLAQIELGNRGIDILELRRLAEVLEFSLDAFMAGDVSSVSNVSTPVMKKARANSRRTSGSFDIVKLKSILLYILERCAGKPNVGETVLYKLLYFSDFNYYELYQEPLTGATYRKLPFGPVPQKWDSVIADMIEKKELQRIKTPYHDYMQTRYIPLIKADLTQFKASEKEVIDKVIAQMSDWSAAAISQYSHRDIPWVATAEGEEIDFELAFRREAPFSVRNPGHDELK